MAMRSNYDISKLSPMTATASRSSASPPMTTTSATAWTFAREVKARGYKLSINPINIMGYADKDLLWIF